MNAGTKYLLDSLMGLMMEVANLRTLNEQKDGRIAELEKELAPYKTSGQAMGNLQQSVDAAAAANLNPAAEDM